MGSYFGKMLTDVMKLSGITKYRLHKLSGVAEPSVIRVANGQKRPTDEIISRFASVKELGLSVETLLQWRMMDDYPQTLVDPDSSPQIQAASFEIAKQIFNSLTEDEQIALIKSKFHLFEQVKRVDDESRRKWPKQD